MVMQRWFPRRAMASWSPLRELEEMEHHLGDLFGRSMMPVWRRAPVVEEGEWMPAIDVYEKGDKFMVKAEIPGMKQEDIDVSVTDSTLSIKGEKKTESEIKDEDYYRCERTYGSFYRSVELPSTVDASKVEASYENGVLEVSIPKMATAKPKKIRVAARKSA